MRSARSLTLRFGALLALAAAGGCGPGSTPNDEAETDRTPAVVARIGDAEIRLKVVRRHADRTALLPEQRARTRPISDALADSNGRSGILFAYPTDDNRSAHVDDDPYGRTTVVAFLDAAGKVDTVHRLGPKEAVALSDGPIRFALFTTATCADAVGLAPGSTIALPKDAADGAEPEFEPIRDPPPVEITVGGKPVRVEVAWRHETRSRGLMYRSYIPDDTGMLFVFRDAREQNFWMRNTRASLDIAYIDENNRIRNVLTMRAHDLDSGGQYRSQGKVVMALETRAGWFRDNGVKRGAEVVLPESVAALRAKADP